MNEWRIALAGNPNTGKSTLFNALTGLKQHTGNWAGKTVLKAEGACMYNGKKYAIVDLPGTYSLFSNSADEEVARDYILFERPDVTVAVLDATSLERNLNLALQVLEITDRAVVCLNMMDEARKLGIRIDTDRLSAKLGVPVVPVSARRGEGLRRLLQTIEGVIRGEIPTFPCRVTYSAQIEEYIARLQPEIERTFGTRFPSRWLALRLLDGDEALMDSLRSLLSVKQSGEVTACGRTVGI